jgi:hypothetical protein
MMRDAGIFPHPNMDALLAATVKSTKQDHQVAVVKGHTRNAVEGLNQRRGWQRG